MTDLRAELRGAAEEAIREHGVSRETVYESLAELRGVLRGRGLDDLEDVVLDVMDYVSGWRSPHMRV